MCYIIICKKKKISKINKTRMHSSRMRTARSLTISHSICCGTHAPPAMHAPLCHTHPLPLMPPMPHMPPCHAHLLPCMPPTMHTPHHACPPPCMPPVTHAPPAMHDPCHACPLPHAMHAPLWTDTHL